MAKIADARTVLRGLAALSGQYPAFAVADADADAASSLTDQFSDWLDVAVKAGVQEPHSRAVHPWPVRKCGRVRAMFGAEVPSLEDTFEGLANFVDQYLGAGALAALLRP